MSKRRDQTTAMPKQHHTATALTRMINTLPKFNTDELRELDDNINRVLFNRNESERGDARENAVVAMASHIAAQYFEKQFAPYTEAKWRLFFIVLMIDKLASVLPDEALREVLGNDIEKELAGTWHQAVSIAEGMGWNIVEEVPEVSEGIKRRLIALNRFIQHGDSILLREFVKQKLNIERLNIPQIGRPSEKTNKWIARRANELRPLYRRGRTGDQTDWKALTDALLTECKTANENDAEFGIKRDAYRAIAFNTSASDRANFIKTTWNNQIGSKHR